MKSFVWIFCLLTIVPPAADAQQTESPLGVRIIVVRTEMDATSILTRLRAGEKFDELAKSASVDSSARDGGYLGILAISELRPEIQAVLKDLKPGETGRTARLGKEFALVQLLTAHDTQEIEFKKWRDAGADPKSSTLGHLWTMAIRSNDLNLVQRLLMSGADVNSLFGDGSTVLMGAAQAGELEIVRSLIAAGANVGSQTRDGTTALLLAAQNGQAGVVRELLTAKAAPDARNKTGGTALIDAAFGGHLDVVRALLDSRADPNLALQDGSNALMAAAGKGNNEIIQALLRAGAQVNAGADSGGTALMEAAYAGRADTVRLLLAAGADPQVANPEGLTALMGAAFGGHTAVVQLLLSSGAAVAPRDKRGWTALTYARASAKSNTVRAILERMTDISAQERSMALGGTYVNEFYSSNDSKLLDLAAAELQKVLDTQPQNPTALEWMGAIEFIRWDKPPTLEQFGKANGLLKKSVALDSKDPDRHYWIAAIDSIFATSEMGAILDEGIEHAKKAIELDPQFADAVDYLSVLYRKKGENALADAARQDAARIRQQRGNRPSRFSDQFSRPALPPPPR
jgi:ankyrin repeat protein